MTVPQEDIRTAGDRRKPLAATLQQKDANGDLQAVNLAGLTVNFRLSDEDGATVIAETAATITGAAAGEVQYDFTAANMTAIETSLGTKDEAIFYAWFSVVESTKTDTFPVAGRKLKIRFVKKWATA